MAEVSGTALAALAVGGVFVYGGLKGKSPLTAFQAIVQGGTPANAPTTAALAGASDATGTGVGSVPGDGPGSSLGSAINPIGSVVGGGNPQAVFKSVAAQFGWDTGPEWDALNNVEMHEAGFNPTVKNPSSGALGIAQALGHGTANTAGSLGNEYGGFGLTDAQARAANSGDPYAQSLWMMNYIKSRYGDPIATWAQYHHPDGTNWY